MSTASGVPEAKAPARRSDVQIVRYEKYIDNELRKTRRMVRMVDLAWGGMALLTGALVYLFLVALVDQWIVSGGLGHVSRAVALGIFLAGGLGWSAWAVAPLLFRRINPVYAAKAIEQSRPSLKNGLVNFLMLRGHPESISPAVYAQIEKQAATGLSQAPLENTVDRSHLLKLAYVLLAIVAVLAIYKVASPKDPIRSVRRVLAPWADIAAPTRVRINDVEPREARAFHGRFVKVSAEVTGLRRDEAPQIFFSTADGQVLAQSLSMSVPPGELRHVAELPPSQGGLQQDMEYWIVAGDASTPHYPIHVLTTPSIVVEKLEYRFPNYTELAPETVDRQGDISAIEGTEVVIYATANEEIQSAYVDFDCDGSRDTAMQVDGRNAKIVLPLVMRKAGELASYQLRFTNRDGEENPEPVRYKIEVTPDRPPEITFTEPIAKEGEEQTIQPNELLQLVVQAADPDFKLKEVKVMIDRKGWPQITNSLLPAPQSSFKGPHILNGNALGLKPGETIEYWAEAVDNKQPTPNRAQTSKRRLRVAALDPKGNKERRQTGDGAGDPEQANRNNDPNQPRNTGADRKDEPRKPGDPNPRGAQKPRKDEGTPKEQTDENNPPPRDTVENPREADPEKPSEDPKHKDRTEKRTRPDREPSRPDDQNLNKDEPQAADQPTPKPEKNGEKEQEKPKRVDPKTDPAKAMEKILERADKERQKQNPQQDQDPPQDPQKDPKKDPNPQQEKPPKKQEPSKEENQDDQPQPQQEQQGGGNGQEGEGEGKGKGKEGAGSQPGEQAGDNGQGTQPGKTDANPQKGGAGEGDDNQPNDAAANGGKAGKGKDKASQDKAAGADRSASGKGKEPDKEKGTGGAAPKGGQNPPNGKAKGDKPEKGPQANSEKTEGANPDALKPDKANLKDGVKNSSKAEKPKGEGEGKDDTGANPKGDPQKPGDKNKEQGPQGKSGKDEGDKPNDPQKAAEQANADPTKSAGQEGEAADGGEGKDGTEKQGPGQKGPGEKGAGAPNQTPKPAEGAADNGPPSGKAGVKPKDDGDKPGDPDGTGGDENPSDPNAKKSKTPPKNADGATFGDKPKDASDDDPLAPPGTQRPDKTGEPKKPEATPGAKGEKRPTDDAEQKEKADGASGQPSPAQKSPKSDSGATGQQSPKGQQQPKGGSNQKKDPSASNPQEQGKNPSAGQSKSSEGTPKSPDQASKPSEPGESAPEAKTSDTSDQPAPSNSSKDSKTKGQEGDQNGAGGTGGGQKSNSAGHGSDGQNTDAETGSGRSEQSGDGETSSRSGNKKPGAPEQGAAPSDKAGKGSTSRPGEKKQAGQTTVQREQPGGEGVGDGEARQGLGQGNPTGGSGLSSDVKAADNGPPPARPDGPTEDEANLDYAKKATDLALDYLKDQLAKGKPDQELLDELQWSRDDMADFVKQWERFKTQANAADPAERKQFEQRLEDLGLRPKGTAIKGGGAQDQRTQTLRETKRSEPPPEYRQQWRVFNSGGAKTRQPAGK
ncbi:MAG TPA: hypothetical protein VGJ26_03330 [Pirellulales bacterium]